MLGDCYACAVVEHLSKDELKIYSSDMGASSDYTSTNKRDFGPQLIVVSVENEKNCKK
jgi:hypothetical protein